MIGLNNVLYLTSSVYFTYEELSTTIVVFINKHYPETNQVSMVIDYFTKNIND